MSSCQSPRWNLTPMLAFATESTRTQGGPARPGVSFSRGPCITLAAAGLTRTQDHTESRCRWMCQPGNESTSSNSASISNSRGLQLSVPAHPGLIKAAWCRSAGWAGSLCHYSLSSLLVWLVATHKAPLGCWIMTSSSSNKGLKTQQLMPLRILLKHFPLYNWNRTRHQWCTQHLILFLHCKAFVY